MNVTLDDDARELRDLAAQVLAGRTAPEQLERTEATPDRFDADLWRELADTGLLAAALPESLGGLGMGVVGAALVCAEVGRTVAPVPYAATACASIVLARCGTPEQQQRWLPGLLSGEQNVVTVPPASVRAHVDGDRLTGELVGVPWAHIADALLLAIDDDVVLLDPKAAGVTATRVETTARQIALNLELDNARVEFGGGPRSGLAEPSSAFGERSEPNGARGEGGRSAAPSGEPNGAGGEGGRAAAARVLRDCWWTMLAAMQAGVTDAAVRMTAAYTSEREQFGKPLSTFQGVALQAADAYVDSKVIDAVALQAAWFLDAEELDPTLAALTAAWWASEAGQHCVHLTQHLHGGMGADITYPVHRYFLHGKQIELMCGAASSLLAELGDALADAPDAGDAVTL